MKTTTAASKTLAALALVLVASLNTACLGGALVNTIASYQTCDDVQLSCKEFIAVTCGRVDDCGGDFDECVDTLIDNGFECDIAWDIEGDMEECLDDVEDLQCDELAEGKSPRSCNRVRLEFEDGVCN